VFPFEQKHVQVVYAKEDAQNLDMVWQCFLSFAFFKNKNKKLN
jgi:hypothetical protein